LVAFSVHATHERLDVGPGALPDRDSSVSYRARLSHGARIARTAWLRERRRSRSTTVVAAGLLVLVAAGAMAGYAASGAFSSGEPVVRVPAVRALGVVVPAVAAVAAARRLAAVVEAIRTDLLLTTVPPADVAVGATLYACSRALVPVATPVLAAVVGVAVGARSVATLALGAVAVVGVAALGSLVGVVVRFAVLLAAVRSPRVRRYGNVARVVVLALAFVGVPVVAPAVASSVPLAAWASATPFAWSVDLALVAAPGLQAGGDRAVAAVVLVAVGTPVAAAAAVAVGVRALSADRVDAGGTDTDSGLAPGGPAARLLGARVSRPTLAVARKRWLQERRVPRVLLAVGYLLLLAPVVYLPVLVSGTVPGVSLVAFAWLCAVGVALPFGLQLLGAEYQALPATLASAPAPHYVRGGLLSGGAVGVPAAVAGVVGLGAVSPLPRAEVALLALAGVALVVCAVTLGVALGFRVPYFGIRRLPVPFVDVELYGTDGRRGFVNLGVVVAVVALVASPAFALYAVAFVGGDLAGLAGANSIAVRAGSLVVTTALAAVVSAWAYRRAVQSFGEYRLP
jgi:ABC-2 type transport system permease protein